MERFFVGCPKFGTVESQVNVQTKQRRMGIGINAFVAGEYTVTTPIARHTGKAYEALCPCGQWHEARRVEYKTHGSMHKCDARCETAKGHKCECECGGANHGKAA